MSWKGVVKVIYHTHLHMAHFPKLKVIKGLILRSARGGVGRGEKKGGGGGLLLLP